MRVGCCANWHRYFVVGNLAADEEEVVRISALLRGMESAVQAVSVSAMLLKLLWMVLMSVVWVEQCRDHGFCGWDLPQLWPLGHLAAAGVAGYSPVWCQSGRSQGGEGLWT